MTRAFALALTLATTVVGCGGDDYGGGSAGSGGAGMTGGSGGAGGAGGAGVPAGKFGASCNLDTECTEPMAICGDSFDRGGKLCTFRCTVATDCPAGSMGQKCNTKGQCRP